MSSKIATCYKDITALLANIKSKEQEIEKRREVMVKYRESEATRKRNENKKDKLTTKEMYERNALESKIDYYRKEISAAQEKFEKYRDYCLSQIALCENKAEAKIQAIEASKNAIDEPELDEDNDKILTRLKKELEQLSTNLKDKEREKDYYEEQFRRNKEQERAMQDLIERNEKAMARAYRSDVIYTDSFYKREEEEKKEEPYVLSVPEPDASTKSLFDKRKEQRIAFKKSPLFLGLTKKQQDQYRDLEYEDQDKVHSFATLKEIKDFLKNMTN